MNKKIQEEVSKMEKIAREKLIEHLDSASFSSFITYKQTGSHSHSENKEEIAGLIFEYSGPNIQFELKSKGFTQHEYSMAETIIQIYIPISKNSELEILK